MWVSVNKLNTIETFKLNKENNFTYMSEKNIKIENCIPIISKMLMYQYQTGFDLKLIGGDKTVKCELLSDRAEVTQQFLENATQGGGDYENYIYNLDYNIPLQTEIIDILASLSIWKYHFDRGQVVRVQILLDNNILKTLHYTKTLDIYRNDFGLSYIGLQFEDTVFLPKNHQGKLEIKMLTGNDNFALFQAQGGDFIHTSCYEQSYDLKHNLDYEVEVLYLREV